MSKKTAPKKFAQEKPNDKPTDIKGDSPKTTGIKQRGSGAATKGFTSRGPMA